MRASDAGRVPIDLTSTTRLWSGTVAGIRLTTGSGSLEQLGEKMRAFHANRVLLVTDAGLVRAGHAERAGKAVTRSGCEVTTFAEVNQNPSDEDVERGVAVARSAEVDALVALGGGSVMDCAKGINFVLTNGGKIEDYWGFGKAAKPMLPMLAVPTTCGTGSEAQSYALISQAGTGRKMACGDPKARFRGVVLDPEVTASAPRWLRSVSGIDAIAHAVESLVSTRATQESKTLSARAYDLLNRAFEPALEDVPGLEPLGQMQFGAYLAGAAIEQSMLGAAHAAANPLTARHRITHGEAVALMLPHVVRWNEDAAGRQYERLHPEGAEALAKRIEALRRHGGLAERLHERNVPRETLGLLAWLATEEWTGKFNPRPMNEQAFLKLYESAHE